MKQFKINFALFAIITAFTIQGCEKEDDVNSNYFSYNGTEYSLDKGFIDYYGKYHDNGTYVWGVFLTTNGIHYDTEKNEFSGKGDIFYVDIISSSDKEIVPGTYSFDETDDFLIDGVIVTMNYDIENETGDYVEFEEGSGTIEISKEEDLYIFSIDCKTKDGKEVKGYYKGYISKIED